MSEFVTEIPQTSDSQVSGASADTPNTSTVNVNLDALKNPVMNLTVFGEVLEITHERTDILGPEDFVYVGSTGNFVDNVYIVVYQDYVLLTIDNTDASYVMEPADSGTHVIRKTNPLGFNSDYPPDETPVMNPNYLSILRANLDGNYTTDRYEKVKIDVIVYTTNMAHTLGTGDAAQEPLGLDARLQSNLAISQINDSFKYSKIPIKMEMVRRYTDIPYTESGTLQGDLNALINGEGELRRPLAAKDTRYQSMG